jgi:2'-5' RNA ligase
MLGIFLEPEGKLKNFISKWKLKIKKKNLKTEYINHPPHSTIYVSNFINEKKVIENVRNITNKFNSFKIQINKTDLFLNDSLTNKDTIFLNIKKNKKIYKLQRNLANNLKSLVKKDKSKASKFFDKKMKNSMIKYGFPFVGAHWKPHFTIGSIKNFQTHFDYQSFKKSKIYFEQEVKTISLWKIKKNSHKKIKVFKLNKR